MADAFWKRFFLFIGFFTTHQKGGKVLARLMVEGNESGPTHRFYMGLLQKNQRTRAFDDMEDWNCWRFSSHKSASFIQCSNTPTGGE